MKNRKRRETSRSPSYEIFLPYANTSVSYTHLTLPTSDLVYLKLSETFRLSLINNHYYWNMN